jgi:hypothetical protein
MGLANRLIPFFYSGPKGATTLVVSGLFFLRRVRAVISGSLILTLVSQKFVDFTYKSLGGPYSRIEDYGLKASITVPGPLQCNEWVLHPLVSSF